MAFKRSGVRLPLAPPQNQHLQWLKPAIPTPLPIAGRASGLPGKAQKGPWAWGCPGYSPGAQSQPVPFLCRLVTHLGQRGQMTHLGQRGQSSQVGQSSQGGEAGSRVHVQAGKNTNQTMARAKAELQTQFYFRSTDSRSRDVLMFAPCHGDPELSFQQPTASRRR
jgi:hypothetical protein